MNNFNLTDWALRHRAVVLFLLLIVAVAGAFSFTRLGQLEDPNFSVPSMTAGVAWPGATAQQMQDEVLNRMEKKLEQIDHFEKVVTFARQGYGGMTLTVKGGTSKADQREAWYQARKKLNDLRLELPDGVDRPGRQRRIRRRLRSDVRRQGRRHQPRRPVRCGRGHQAAHAQGADGQEGRRDRQAGQARLHRVLARAPGRAGHHAAGDRRQPEEPERNVARGPGRHPWRPRHGARERPVRQRRRHPQRADLGRRPDDQAGRHRDRPARPRRPADLHRAPQRPAGADDRHLDDRRRQHRRAWQGDGGRGREDPGRAAARRGTGACGRPAHHRQGVDLGLRSAR